MTKKLLILTSLLISGSLWAEETVLLCESHSEWSHKTKSLSETNTEYSSLIINTVTNTVTKEGSKDIAVPYKVGGASITWRTMYTIQDGDIQLRRQVHELNRLNGGYYRTYESTNVEPVDLDSLTRNVVEKFHEESLWKKSSQTNFECKRMGPLF